MAQSLVCVIFLLLNWGFEMNGAINFTETFSNQIMWGWPIAIYLLLAGMSGGALIVAILIRYYKKEEFFSPLFKSASILSLITILIGMIFLVGDLDKPLYFWKILINYNFKSVMSIGVAALCVYITFCFILCFYAFESEISQFLSQKIKTLSSVFEILMKILGFLRPLIIFLTLIFAVIICAYTGFLISVLIRFPILNTAVLPMLFVASGLSAGIGGSSLIAAYFFKQDFHAIDLKILHKLEMPVIFLEILLIFMLFVSLIIGSDAQKIASEAFLYGFWAKVFWVGVVGTGFCIPLFLLIFGRNLSAFAFYLSGISSIIGVLMLRIFILYAGQSYSIFI